MSVFVQPLQDREDLKRTLKALTLLQERVDLHRLTICRDTHVDEWVNLFQGITPDIEQQFSFFNYGQQVSGFIILAAVEYFNMQQNAIKYLKKLPDGRGFIQGPPGTGKSTLIKHVASAVLEIDEHQGTQPQILISCPSNDGVNSVCKNTHSTFPRRKALRAYPYSVELQHVKALAKKYNGGSDTEQVIEHVPKSHITQLLGQSLDHQKIRNRSLLYIGGGERTLQRVGLRDEDGRFIAADGRFIVDSDNDPDHFAQFRSLFRSFNVLDRTGELEFDELFKELYKQTLKVCFTSASCCPAANALIPTRTHSFCS